MNNNFFERAIALQNQYYEEELASRKRTLESTDFPDFIKEFCSKPLDPSTLPKIGILSQLVATYVTYGGKFPTKFTLKLSDNFFISYLSKLLKEISTDLAIEGEFIIPKEEPIGRDVYCYNVLFIR